jgi:hypothetical protein
LFLAVLLRLGAVKCGFLGPKLSKICMNLVKKLLPAGHLTIIIESLVVKINGYQSLTNSAAGG